MSKVYTAHELRQVLKGLLPHTKLKVSDEGFVIVPNSEEVLPKPREYRGSINLTQADELFAQGFNKSQIARKLNVSRQHLQAALNQRKASADFIQVNEQSKTEP